MRFITALFSLSSSEKDDYVSFSSPRYLSDSSFLSKINSSQLPKGLINQTKEEREYLGYHKCADVFEAYGAAYLITKEHLTLQNTNYSLGWVNCEMASFIMMKERNIRMIRGAPGTVIQTLDVLDFSVLHLSAYERALRKHARYIKSMKHPTSIEVMENVTNIMLENLRIQSPSSSSSSSKIDQHTQDMNRTLVVMPFLGTGMGSGHSVLANRYVYLKTCFWSLYLEWKHIVVGVTSQEDYNYCRDKSGLPFYDVILNENLPKGASNPVSTVQQVKQRFLDGRYSTDFDYIFFTESDQVLLMRQSHTLYEILKSFPRYVIIPHRLMPYPSVVIKAKFLKSTIRPEKFNHTWKDMSCCLPRQNCRSRSSWVPLRDPSVPLLNIYGLPTPLGNCNFLDEVYRSCVLTTDQRLEYCP